MSDGFAGMVLVRDAPQHLINARVRSLLDKARARARARGVVFSLRARDVRVPTCCPVLGIELAFGDPTLWGLPSLDRIAPSGGYTPANVRVISYRANTLKNNATANELRLVLQDLEQATKGGRPSREVSDWTAGEPERKAFARTLQDLVTETGSEEAVASIIGTYGAHVRRILGGAGVRISTINRAKAAITEWRSKTQKAALAARTMGPVESRAVFLLLRGETQAAVAGALTSEFGVYVSRRQVADWQQRHGLPGGLRARRLVGGTADSGRTT